MTQYWLVKSEPEECGIDDFITKADGIIRWDGVRNYQARNFIRAMQVGDFVHLYHASCSQVGIAGTLKVVSAAYPDPLQFAPDSAYFDAKSSPENPRWSAIDLGFVGKAEAVLSLKRIKQMSALSESMLVTRPRLSVMPLSNNEWACIQQVLSYCPLST